MPPSTSSPSPVTWRAKDGTVITWSDDEGSTIDAGHLGPDAPPEALELIEERKANPDDDGLDENGELRIY